MNNLNSIIFEGTVSDRSCWMSDDRTEFRCVVSATRTFKKDGERVSEVCNIDMYASDKVGLACDKHLTDGRGIRCVGRLMNHPEGSVAIYAEHVEFKPIYAKGVLDGR